MSKWIRIASIDDCPPGTACELVVEDRIIALYNIDGTFHALDGICPHQGGPLGKGTLTGCVVTCPWHGWQFDVTTGQHQTSASLRHAPFAVKVDNDAVWVDLEG
ncbi:MAG: ferredoxin [Planctomycetaceae bacterium]|nr:ferredoxin [Planctomycetaceae bacterium]